MKELDLNGFSRGACLGGVNDFEEAKETYSKPLGWFLLRSSINHRNGDLRLRNDRLDP
jgi:hypothetical protein